MHRSIASFLVSFLLLATAALELLLLLAPAPAPGAANAAAAAATAGPPFCFFIAVFKLPRFSTFSAYSLSFHTLSKRIFSPPQITTPSFSESQPIV